MMYLRRGKLHDARPPATDPAATDATRVLLWRLKNEFGRREEEMMIGANGSGALIFGPTWTHTLDRVQTLTGRRPLFFAANWVNPSNSEHANMVAAIKAHHAAGGMCGLTFEFGNILTGGDVYDRDKSDFSAVTQCLSPSGTALATYRSTYLDRLADTVNNYLIDDNGERIPLVCRFLVEMNGWFDFPDMSVTSLTRVGTTATMDISGTLSASWAPGVRLQIRGATPTGWNTLWTVSSYSILTGSVGSAGTARVTFTVPNTLTTPATGTITTYLASGYLWAGADRAADVKTLIQQSITYLRDTAGVHSMLYACSMYPDNELFSSTNPATNPYSTWLNGMENWFDVVSVNLYNNTNPDSPTIDFGRQRMQDSMQIFADWCDTNQKPLMIWEHGARTAGGSGVDFWSTRCFGRFDALYPRLAAVLFWSPDWLPTDGTPAVADFRKAMNNARYRWVA